MADELTIADVDQAEARLADAKANLTGQEYRDVKREVVAIRSAWRQQEEAAGRRAGRVGGDAVETGG